MEPYGNRAPEEAKAELEALITAELQKRTACNGALVTDVNGRIVAKFMPQDAQAEDLALHLTDIFRKAREAASDILSCHQSERTPIVFDFQECILHQLLVVTTTGTILAGDFGGGLLILQSSSTDAESLSPLND